MRKRRDTKTIKTKNILGLDFILFYYISIGLLLMVVFWSKIEVYMGNLLAQGTSVGTNAQSAVSVNCTATNFGSSAGINTAIGCIPISDQSLLAAFFLRWGLGIGGGIAFLLILMAGFQIMTSRGDPNRLKAGQELMTSAITGLILLIFSIFVLKLIGVDILGISDLFSGI